MTFVKLLLIPFTCFLLLGPPEAGASELPTGLQCVNQGFGEPRTWFHIDVEELERFQQMYVMSDFHGHLHTSMALLKGTGLVVDTETQGVLGWSSDPDVKDSLIIVIGDYINGGNESIEVVRLFEELRKTTPAKHRLVLLIGNHEAQLLAGSSKHFANPEMKISLSDASVRQWLGLSERPPGSALTPRDLLNAPNFKRFTDSLRLGGVVGRWLMGHSGYFGISTALTEATGKTAVVCDYVRELTMAYREARMDELTLEQHSTSSFLMDHQWWRKKMENAEANWDAIGLRGLVQGHSRFSMGYCGDVEISCPSDWPAQTTCSPCRNTDGEIYALEGKSGESSRFLKIDSGVKFGKPGRILSCPITPELLKDMDLARDCVQMDRDGSSYDIPQSFNTEGHYLM